MRVKNLMLNSILTFLIFTIICGVIYTALVTGVAQLLFHEKANGSIISVDGKKYGSLLLGQSFTDSSYMWGRIMNIDVSTFKDEEGNPLLYASPSNLSPNSKEFEALVESRVNEIKKANPDMADTPIPVELVTCSGSGLDPEISPSAAYYQVSRIAKERNISNEEVYSIIEKCTKGRFLNLFGEETVNVLKVNLMLDGIIK